MGKNTALRIVSVGLFVAGLCLAEPAPAAGQGLGIWGGVYSPLGKSIDVGGIGGSIQRNNSFVGGLRLTGWGSGLLGLEATAGYSPANVEIAGATINETRHLNLFTGGLKLMLGVSPAMSPVGFHVGAGPAIIRRGRDVTSESTSQTAFGGVFGAGLRIPFASAVWLRIDGEDYLYKMSFGGDPKKTRNDLILSTGLSFGF